MSARSERQQASEAVAAYHGAALAELVAHVAEAIDRFRAGELDAFEVDQILFQYSRSAKELWRFCNMTNIEYQILFQYSRSAKELWRFCNMTNIEFTARLVQEQPSIDWWERGAPNKR